MEGRATPGSSVRQFVERVGGAARSSRRGAAQGEAADPARVPDGQLLGDHATEGDADHGAVVPTDGVDQGGGIVGVVSHGVRALGDFGLAEAALVVGQDLEGGVEGFGHAGLLAQVAPGARNAEEAIRPVGPLLPGQLVVDGDAVGEGVGHVGQRIEQGGGWSAVPAMMADMGYGQFSFSGSVAEGYRAYLEPIIFEPWADELVRFAGVAAGEVVLDVAAGTGAVSRAAARAAGPKGRVVATDISEDMLAQVVRGDEPAVIETVVCSATELDLTSGVADVVLCQQGLQFFPDRGAAAAEMRRVLRPGGRVAAAVWLSDVPLHPFGLYGEVLAASGLDENIDIRRFMMSPDEVGSLLAGAGFGEMELETRTLSFRWAGPRVGARQWGDAVPNLPVHLAAGSPA